MRKDEQSIADQIFISYARPEHIDAARILRLELQQRKLNVFLDEESIRSGDQWITRLEAALRDCVVSQGASE